MTKGGPHSFNKLTLHFADASTEADYQHYMLDKNRNYCRIAWILLMFLAVGFLPFDRLFFADHLVALMLGRGILVALAAVALSLSYATRLRRVFLYNSAAFISILGAFSIFLIARSDPSTYTPYFTAMFFAFAGIFSTAGLGFRAAVPAQLLVFIGFEIVFGFFVPLAPRVFIIYSALLPGIILVFAYTGYLIERISRENFAVADQLRGSLEQVKQLSGLLPICAHCKSIRDDQGYWSRIEDYLDNHSEVSFTHGICPTCTESVEAEIKRHRPPKSSTPAGPVN